MGDESNRAEMLQFWIDAQLPPALAQWLQRAHGTEARHVEDLGLYRAEDTKIFTEARATDRPVVALLEGGLSPFADLEVPLAHLSDNVKEPCYPVEDFSLMEGLPNISTYLQSQRPAGISIDD